MTYVIEQRLTINLFEGAEYGMAMELADYQDAGFASIWQPGSVEEAWRLKRSFGGKSSYAASGTLLRTQWQSGQRPEPKHLISLAGIPELRGLRLTDGALSIGAIAALDECRQHPLLKRHGELLVTAIDQIAELTVRHLATIGGHVASLVGDAVPALQAMNAQLVLFREIGWSRYPILDWIQGKGGVREPDDLLVRVEIPIECESDSDRAKRELLVFYEEAGRRKMFASSVAEVAAQGEPTEDEHTRELQMPVGSSSAMPDWQSKTERAINGSALSGNMLGLIQEAIRGQYKAAEDLFEGRAYRKEATANLISAQLWKMMERK